MQLKYFLIKGYFGKGEFSRGEPILNKKNEAESNPNDITIEEFSLNLKNITFMTNEK